MEMDIREICVQEIALEGLEGITTPALWLRLENREPKPLCKLTGSLKEFLWKFILHHPSLEIFRIPNPRDEPQIFDRFKGSEMACVPVSSAPDERGTLVELYSSNAVEDVEGIRGACSNYQERENVTNEIRNQMYDLEKSMEKYGSKQLVIVASQALREEEYLVGNMSRQILDDLNNVFYCVLERIARARWQGELQAVLNKLDFCNKSQHIHYIIDKLHKLGLVSKLNHTYRLSDKSNRPTFQIVITLRKFERECVTFSSRMISNFIEELKKAPNHTMNLGELRDKMEVEPKAFKTTYKHLLKSGDILICSIKADKKPRTVHENRVTLIEKQNVVTDEDDEEEDVQSLFSKTTLSVKPLILERPLLYQAYQFALDNGIKGVTQRQMLLFFKGFGRLEARSFCKMLYKSKLVDMVLVDEGRQRTQTYIPKNCSFLSTKSLEFSDERKKMKKLLVETTKRQSNSSMASASENIQSPKSATPTPKIKPQRKGKQQKSETNEKKTASSALEISSVEECTSVNGASASVSELTSLHVSQDKQPVKFHAKKWDANLTTRKIKRHNIILEHLNQEKIIEGYRVIQKILCTVEEKEGITARIDKKTIVRLIDKMNEDGVLKHSVIPVTHNERTENCHFIMAVDCTPALLKSAIDQTKFRMMGEDENRAARLEQQKVSEDKRVQKKKMKEMNDSFSKAETRRTKRKLMHKFFQPKFKRLRAIHQYLWYLAYSHPNRADKDLDKSFTNPDNVTVYDAKPTWKKFLPPAPIHIRDGLRWLQVGDVAMILPLSLFCKFQRVPYKKDELEHWLMDENKRHTLVRHLPPDLKSALLYKRRYMFAFTSCIEHLAFMGLVSTTRGRQGGNSNMPRENMMVYVHRHATVFDTRTSGNRHIKVEDKPYEKLCFVFDEFQDLHNYWIKLQAVCMLTRLGFVDYREPGYDMIREHLSHVELKKFVAISNETESVPNDDGSIPGDHRGAGGLDSSMFSYLYRNWHMKLVTLGDPGPDGDEEFSSSAPKRLPKLKSKNLTLNNRKKKVVSDELALIPANHHGYLEKSNEIEPTAVSQKKASSHVVSASEKRPHKDSIGDGIKAAKTKKKQRSSGSSARREPALVEKQTQPDVRIVSNVGRNERVKGGRGVKRKASNDSESLRVSSDAVKDILEKNRGKRRRYDKEQQQGVIRQGKQRVKYVDKHDLAAIQERKGRLRVTFTYAEDSLYLLCHVTTSLLVQLYWKKPFKPRKQIVPWSVIRDISQKLIPESIDKTSYSVARRTHVIMRSPETRICHDISVAEILDDKEFLDEHFPKQIDLEGEPDRLVQIYPGLVDQLRKRLQVQPGLFTNEIPNTSKEVLDMYVPKSILRKDGDIQEKRHYFDDTIVTTIDIKKSVAENMAYIALTMPDSEFTIYQAYRAFEEFPEQAMSEVFTNMKVSGFVCSKRIPFRKVPFAILAYRLSYAQAFSLRAVVPSSVVDQVSEGLRRTSDIKIHSEAPLESIFLMSYLFTKGPIDLRLQIPDQVVLPETPKEPLFGNQFMEMLEEVKQDLMKESQGIQGNSNDESTVPPDSLMAAAACILKENLNQLPKDDAEDTESSVDDAKVMAKMKMAEIMRLYNRHPSYTNWLMLINPEKKNESKFANINYAVSSDCIVLSPCTVTIGNTVSLIENYTEEVCTNRQTHPVTTINELLNSVKINLEVSTNKWMEQQAGRVDGESFILKAVFDPIEKSSSLGISKLDLLSSLSFDLFTVNSALKKLLENRIVFSVGIKKTRFVSFNHVEPWVAKGFSYCANEDFKKEILYELELFQSESIEGSKKKKAVDKTSSGNSGMKSNKIASKMPSTSERVMSKYKEIKFLCRPWHTLSGNISFANAKSMLVSVFLKIYSSPGITQEHICASYSYQSICVTELLGILQEAGCITEHSVECQGGKRLFGVPGRKKTVLYYEATADGLFIVCQWVNTVNEKISV